MDTNLSQTSKKAYSLLQDKLNSLPAAKEGYCVGVAAYIISSLALIYLIYLYCRTHWYYETALAFFSITIWGALRWVVKFIHIIRVIVYKKIVFPALKKKAGHTMGNLSHLYVVVPTYLEKDYITYAVFESISKEIQRISVPCTIVINCGNDADIAHVQQALADHPLKPDTALFILRQKGKGKRNALVESLLHIKRYGCGDDAAVILMDGDSIWKPNLLHNTLPFFGKFPRLGAITTNEELVCFGSKFYEHWFAYRLAQRDFYMSSHSLSKRVLCLTGRFSIYRSCVVMQDSFLAMLADDGINHWFWGHIRFLGGDDKSTWYWLYRNGRKKGLEQMFYIPDASICTIEHIHENGFIRSIKNLNRWSVNTARNNFRGLQVLPFFKAPLFIWFCILFQRTSMYTNLLYITIAVILSVSINLIFFPAFLYLALIGILIMITAFSLSRKRLLTWGLLIHPYNQWVGGLIRLWAFSHLAFQKWSHRGGQQNCISQKRIAHTLRLVYARFEFVYKLILIILAAFLMIKAIDPFSDILILGLCIR